MHKILTWRGAVCEDCTVASEMKPAEKGKGTIRPTNATNRGESNQSSDSKDASGEPNSCLTEWKEIVIFQKPYVYRNKVRKLKRFEYSLLIGKEKEEWPRTYLVVFSDLTAVSLSHLRTKDLCGDF